jgi:hypothetical protein
MTAERLNACKDHATDFPAQALRHSCTEKMITELFRENLNHSHRKVEFSKDQYIVKLLGYWENHTDRQEGVNTGFK